MAKDACKNQFKNKKSDNLFATRQNNTAQRKKDESCTSKRQEKQANDFEINRISNVLI